MSGTYIVIVLLVSPNKLMSVLGFDIPLYSIVVNEVIDENAEPPIIVTLDGIVIDSINEISLNA